MMKKLILCLAYILSFGEFSSPDVLQKPLQVVEWHNRNTLPCPLTSNFIISPISLEKTTSKQKITVLNPFVATMDQGYLPWWKGSSCRSMQTRKLKD